MDKESNKKLPLIIFAITILVGILSIILSLMIQKKLPEIFPGEPYPSQSPADGTCTTSAQCGPGQCCVDGRCQSGHDDPWCCGGNGGESPPPLGCWDFCTPGQGRCPYGLRCLTNPATGRSRCANPTCPLDSDCLCEAKSPSPSPSVSPSPSPAFECTGLGPQPASPQPGQQLTFTCKASATHTSINHYNFRVNKGTPTRVNTSQLQANFTYKVPDTGTFNVQCQVCTSSDESNCTAWGQAK